MWKKRAHELRMQGITSTMDILKILQQEFGVTFNKNSIRRVISEQRRKEKEETKEVMPNTYDNVVKERWSGNQIIRFGVVSDTHLCSKHQQLTYLNETYDLFKSEGIDTVYHVGDLTEGFKMRAGHEYEIFKHGADEQVQYVIDKYPKREGMVTKFILGNHDLSHIKNGGINIGKAITYKRKDMEYIGSLNAKVYLTPNCTMEVNHPLDGASYALSYAIQKMADSYSGDAKPNILLNGHHHKMAYLFYRNIHCFECGTFEAQTPWMRGKRIAAHVGGMIITIEVDCKGTIVKLTPQFLPYYSEIKNDY